MSRELLKQALYALKYHSIQTRPIDLTNETIEALCQELAKPEQEHMFDTPESHIVKWSIPVDPNNFGEPLAQPEPQVCCNDYEKCIKACTPRGRWLAEQELAKPEQEPEIVRRVKRYMGKRRESVGSPHITAKECIALANWIDSILTAPSRKEWVGLTDDEIKEVLDLNVAPWSLSGVALQHVMDDARALEAKLKEKNNAV